MDTVITWVKDHWEWIAFPVGGLLALVSIIVLLLLGAWVISTLRRRLAESALARLHHQKDQAIVRKDLEAVGENTLRLEIAAERQALAAEKALRAGEATLIGSMKEALAALRENLANREETIRRGSDGLAQEAKRYKKLLEDNQAKSSALANANAECERLSQENADLSTTCSMLEKQLKNQETSVAMLQNTVTDLNSHRDRLTSDLSSSRELVEVLKKQTQSS